MGFGLPGREPACTLAWYLRTNGPADLDRLCIVLIYPSRRVKPQKILLAEHSVEEIERGGIWPAGPGAGPVPKLRHRHFDVHLFNLVI